MSSFDRSVRDYMSSPVLSVPMDALLADVEQRLHALQVSSLAVTDGEGHLVGVISRTDLLRVGRIHARAVHRPALLTLPDRRVGEVMTERPTTVPADAPIALAARRFVDQHIHRVFVVAEERPVGVVSTRDVMRAVIDEKIRTPISQFMSAPVIAVDVADPLWQASDLLANAHVSGLVVLDEGKPVGLYTQVEALEARDLPDHSPVGDVMGYSMVCLATTMPLFRAAAFAVNTRVRRILAVENHDVKGILTGIDLARVAAA